MTLPVVASEARGAEVSAAAGTDESEQITAAVWGPGAARGEKVPRPRELERSPDHLLSPPALASPQHHPPRGTSDQGSSTLSA